MEHWIAVADSQRCRIFATDDAMERWSPVRELDHPGLYPDPGDLGGRGRSQSRPGGAKTALERPTDPVESERRRFAREVAATLEEGLAAGAWERLVLAAPPRFLGLLRGELAASVERRVVAAIPHDFVKTSLHELPSAIRRHLPDLAGFR